MTGKAKDTLFWLGVLVCVLLAGFAALHFLLGYSLVDSLFYTLTTLTTVGYGEPPGLNEGGKLFMSLLMFAGIGVVGISLAKLAEHFFMGSVLEALGRRRDHMLDRLNDHWIICGVGQVGRKVAEHFSEGGVAFVGIDSDPEADAAARAHRWTMILGDATEEEILLQAGLMRACGMIVCMSNDADNVYTVLTARAHNRTMRIVARSSSEQSTTTLYRAGADRVINPVQTGASALAWASLKPNVSDFFDLVDVHGHFRLSFDTAVIGENSPLRGVRLRDSELRSRFEAMVVAILHHNGVSVYNPPADEVLEEGDELLMLCPKERMEAFREMNRGEAEPTFSTSDLPT